MCTASQAQQCLCADELAQAAGCVGIQLQAYKDGQCGAAAEAGDGVHTVSKGCKAGAPASSSRWGCASAQSGGTAGRDLLRAALAEPEHAQQLKVTKALCQGFGDQLLPPLLLLLQLLPAAGAGTLRALLLLASGPHKQPVASHIQDQQRGLLCLVSACLCVHGCRVGFAVHCMHAQGSPPNLQLHDAVSSEATMQLESAHRTSSSACTAASSACEAIVAAGCSVLSAVDASRLLCCPEEDMTCVCSRSTYNHTKLRLCHLLFR